jgi:hypothetical protein
MDFAELVDPGVNRLHGVDEVRLAESIHPLPDISVCAQANPE